MRHFSYLKSFHNPVPGVRTLDTFIAEKRFLGKFTLLAPPEGLAPIESLPEPGSVRFTRLASTDREKVGEDGMLAMARALGTPQFTLPQVIELSKWRNELARREAQYIRDGGLVDIPLFSHTTVFPSVLARHGEMPTLRYVACIHWGDQNLLQWRYTGVLYRHTDTLLYFAE